MKDISELNNNDYDAPTILGCKQIYENKDMEWVISGAYLYEGYCAPVL